MNAVERLALRLLSGEPRAVARAIRLVDDRDARHGELLKRIYPHRRGAWVIGVTGTPGSGKSTLVDQLVQRYRGEGRRVGVLAIDPTSPFSGGAILGDRIRMQRHFLDDDVFIRSLATRGQLGGLSRATLGAAYVLDAAGFDPVIVETVGVGQDELDVARLAHTTCVVSAPGLGDDVQAIKAGILEVADVLIVNKADRPGADAAVRNLQSMVALGHSARDAGADPVPGHFAHGAAAYGRGPGNGASGEWEPPIVATVATRGEGVDLLVAEIAAHRAVVEASPTGKRERVAAHVAAILEDACWTHMLERLSLEKTQWADRVVAGTADPYTLAEEVLARWQFVPESQARADKEPPNR